MFKLDLTGLHKLFWAVHMMIKLIFGVLGALYFKYSQAKYFSKVILLEVY